MILYLLVPALLLGAVEPQTAKVTEDEGSQSEGNQTVSLSTGDNRTVTLSNATSSSTKDQLSRMKMELQSNRTSDVITEDDENFQDQEDMLPAGRCRVDILEEYSHAVCGPVFYKEMLSMSTEDWCVLDNIIRPYYDMTLCLEKLSNMVGCYYPNPNIQDFFLHIHSFFFQNCSREEYHLEDAPQWLVMVLTLVPVCLIPVLVYLVVWKSKVQE